MRLSRRSLAAVSAIVALTACGSSKGPQTGDTTTTAGTSATTVAPGPTAAGALDQFVYQPDGFCQAFSNYLTYVTVVAAPSVGGSSDSSTTLAPAEADVKAGAAALAFAPAIAPTTQVLQGDAPEEILPVFHDFDAYNDAAVTTLGNLGVDTDKLGPTEAGELAAVDPRAPEKFPDADSVAAEAGVDVAKLNDAAASFVKDHGTLAAVFQKYAGIPDPTPERQKELVAKYPCMSAAFGGTGS
jgi:predicted small lipoprotein YifL